MGNNTYKPSNKFNFAGLLLIILGVAGAGCLVSLVYLKINKINPIVYLTILLTVGFGAIIGVVANFVIKKFKIRNAGMAMLAVLIGALIFTYFKWATYVYWDNQEILHDGKEDYNLTEEYMISELPYLGNTLGDLLTSPSELWSQIKDINESGRWSYRASRSSSVPKTPVKGIPLTIVWLVEAAILIGLPMIMASGKAKQPYSETEDDWLKEYKNVFMFGNYNLNVNKQIILNNPDEIFNIPLFENVPNQNHVKGTLYHSSDFSECYMTLSSQTYNAKNKKFDSSDVIQYLTLTYPQVDRLFDYFKMNKPFASATSYNYQQPTYQQPVYEQPSYQQPTYQQPQQPTQSNSDYVNPDVFFK